MLSVLLLLAIVLSVLLLLTIVLSVLLRYTDSDYPFGIFKLFFLIIEYKKNHSDMCSCDIFLANQRIVSEGYRGVKDTN